MGQQLTYLQTRLRRNNRVRPVTEQERERVTAWQSQLSTLREFFLRISRRRVNELNQLEMRLSEQVRQMTEQEERLRAEQEQVTILQSQLSASNELITTYRQREIEWQQEETILRDELTDIQEQLRVEQQQVRELQNQLSTKEGELISMRESLQANTVMPLANTIAERVRTAPAQRAGTGRPINFAGQGEQIRMGQQPVVGERRTERDLNSLRVSIQGGVRGRCANRAGQRRQIRIGRQELGNIPQRVPLPGTQRPRTAIPARRTPREGSTNSAGQSVVGSQNHWTGHTSISASANTPQRVPEPQRPRTATLARRIPREGSTNSASQRQLSRRERQTVTGPRRQLRTNDQDARTMTEQISEPQQRVNDSPDWVINRNAREFQIFRDQELGRGAWGVVYRGTFCRRDVAVKEMHEGILSPENRASFEREVDIAARCRHPCLLQFIGATTDGMAPLLVTEIMDCTLRSRLYNEGEQALCEAEIVVISLDVAQALNYLHQKRPSPIIHSDISSANVLLWRQGRRWKGKVSDYGTANFVRRSTRNYPGAIIYSAPEYLNEAHNQLVMISCKVDVYSFGVLLCEMSIREMPDPQRRAIQIPRMTNLELRYLASRCTLQEPGERPNMEEIIDELEAL